MRFSTRELVLSGLLAALTAVMGATILGFVPIPNVSGAVTTVHLPVIIGGILLGPFKSSLLGLVFGLFTLRFLGDPLVVVLPRLFIGPVAYLVYRGMPKGMVGLGAAGIAGTLTNTIGVLSMAVIRGYFPLKAVLPVAAVNGTIEVVLAAILVPAIVAAIQRIPVLQAEG